MITKLYLLALLFSLAGCNFILASANTAKAVPPFLQYLTESDLEAARQLAQARHSKAVEDALSNFPVDEFPCSAAEDKAAVENIPFRELKLHTNAKLPDYHDELTKSVFVSQKPLLTREECSRIIRLADEHFEANGKDVGGDKWTALPSGEYKMRGFKLIDIPPIREFFAEVFRKRFLPIVQHTNPKFAESISDLALDECYLMKFTPDTGKRMDIHADDGCLSFTIQMNPKEEYEGGGTWFEGLAEDESNQAAGIVKMDVGHVHFRPGGIRHMGNTIRSGKRYVVGGFPLHRTKVEYSRLLMKENSNDQFDLAIPALVALNPEYDDGYAVLAYDWDTRLGRTEDAKEVLEYCLQHVNPKCSKVAFSLGMRHYLPEGKYDKVMELMDIVLTYDPYDVRAMVAMAEAASQVGHEDVEKEMYQRIVKVETVTSQVQANAYRDLGLLFKGKDTKAEIECYELAIAANDNYHARFSLGRALFDSGELDKARESFLLAYSLDDSSTGVLKALYRTARTIMAKEAYDSPDPGVSSRTLVELVGGQEIYDKIQALMVSPFA